MVLSTRSHLYLLLMTFIFEYSLALSQHINIMVNESWTDDSGFIQTSNAKTLDGLQM